MNDVLAKEIAKIFLNKQIPTESHSLSVNLDQLEEVTKEFYKLLRPGDWLFLDGDLGTGKTTFVKSLINLYNSNENTSSPTFSILNSIHLPIIDRANNIKKIIHLDLYRLKKGSELLYLGLEQEFTNKEAICIFEWPYNVDTEDFKVFFQTTACPQPIRIIELSIELDSAENTRIYSIRKILL